MISRMSGHGRRDKVCQAFKIKHACALGREGRILYWRDNVCQAFRIKQACALAREGRIVHIAICIYLYICIYRCIYRLILCQTKLCIGIPLSILLADANNYCITLTKPRQLLHHSQTAIGLASLYTQHSRLGLMEPTGHSKSYVLRSDSLFD